MAHASLDARYVPLFQRGKCLQEQVSKSYFPEKWKDGDTNLDLWSDGNVNMYVYILEILAHECARDSHV